MAEGVLFVVILLFCAAIAAALKAAGFCKDTPVATEGEDLEKLAFRQVSSLLLEPPRFKFATPDAGLYPNCHNRL